MVTLIMVYYTTHPVFNNYLKYNLNSLLINQIV